MSHDLIGQTLGAYRILEKIGRGGMASVYKAYQPALDRSVAIKVLPPHLADEPGFKERFQREARAVAKLEHPHILPVYDYGHDGDLSFIVMRYVETGTLRRIMSIPMQTSRIIDVVGQIAGALDHAHRNGIIHRDVKPSNVLLDERDWSLLTDFGLARMMEVSQQITASGVGMGTPTYMSPEQGMADRVDHRTDIYSLGVMLYEMLTGKVPYEAETPLAVVLKHINDPLPLPSDVNPDIPKAVERVVLKAMAKSPSDRFQQAGQLAVSLEEATHDATSTRDDKRPLGERTTEPIRAEAQTIALWRKSLRRYWWLLATGLVIALAGFAILRLPQTSQFQGGVIEEIRGQTNGGEPVVEYEADATPIHSQGASVTQNTTSEHSGDQSAATDEPNDVVSDLGATPEKRDAKLDPGFTLYDEFESSGQVNPLRWWSETNFRVRDGAAILEASLGEQSSHLWDLSPSDTWNPASSGEVRFAVQADMLVGRSLADEYGGGSTEITLHSPTLLPDGGNWAFVLGYAYESGYISYQCNGTQYRPSQDDSGLYSKLTGTPLFGEWHTFRISIEESAESQDLALVGYVDGKEICSWVPPSEWQDAMDSISFWLINNWNRPWT
ncbi:MAG: protein kinase, partial [Anaerolineales bacterium]